MKNEKILIFGDSYSTFRGYVPDGYLAYYPIETHKDVSDVSRTWWHMLATQTSSEIVLNNSWSGSPVCHIGWNGECSDSESFIYRLKELIADNFFEKNEIDRIFVFGGTNDSWIGNPCGDVQFSGWTDEDLKSPLPGYSYFIDKLVANAPKEKVHVIINCELREELEKGILDICNHYGLSHTLLHDIDKVEGHPTYSGMTEIKNQVLESLK